MRTYRPPIGRATTARSTRSPCRRTASGSRLAAGTPTTSRTRTASICSTARPTARSAGSSCPSRSSTIWHSRRTAPRSLHRSTARTACAIIDAKTGKVLLADRDYAERSRGLAFGPDDTLYAVAYDGYLRHYGRNYKRTHKVKTPGGQRPHSIAVDPTGKRVAVGYDDTRTVEIFDARTLERIAVADNSDIENGNLLACRLVVGRQVRLSAAGAISGCSTAQWQYPVRIWDANGRQVNEVMVADNTILHMVPCGDFGLLRRAWSGLWPDRSAGRDGDQDRPAADPGHARQARREASRSRRTGCGCGLGWRLSRRSGGVRSRGRHAAGRAERAAGSDASRM